MSQLASPTPRELAAITWRRPVAWLFDRTIAGYQRWISPVLPPACRFTPSCSHYARQALQHHGVARAVVLTVWRLLRCQPLCTGGHDPVPRGRYSPAGAVTAAPEVS